MYADVCIFVTPILNIATWCGLEFIYAVTTLFANESALSSAPLKATEQIISLHPPGGNKDECSIILVSVSFCAALAQYSSVSLLYLSVWIKL